MKRLGKKGMMDDLFDLLFTVMAAIFVLFFVQLVLSGGAAGAEERSVVNLNAMNARENFLFLLKLPVNDKENLFDLLKTVGSQDRSAEFNRAMEETMKKSYPSELDWWWVRVYKEDEKPTDSEEIFGRYTDYGAGGDKCRPYARSITEEILISQADGTKAKLVYCVATWEYRTSFD
ncbi:hypothetical protein GOV03_02590 [Candidatus Woesearchaeota archaeon]|nr:hypothetical protein [Candidatus Woesearchaeota archaeon]